MYAIAGVSGNTGSVVARTLLDAGEKVRVWVRDEEKGRPFAERGAQVAVVDLTDPTSIRRGLEGARGAYLLLPPDLRTPGYLEERKRTADALAAALRGSGLAHAVVLSSIGAQHPTGTGVIRALHYAEQALGGAGVPTTFVRAAYFMENWLSSLGPAKADGVLPQMFADSRAKVPMVATADIGRTAAEALRAGPSAEHVIELEGPERYAPTDVAAILGELLGRPLQVVDVPFAAQEPTLTSFGIAPDVAALFREMNEGISSGRVDWEGGAARHVKGTVGMRAFLQSKL